MDIKAHQRAVAKERIDHLLKMIKIYPEKRNRYAFLIWRIAQKHRVKLKKLKYRFCRRCFTWWTPDSLMVRIVRRPSPSILYKCKVCGEEYRFPLVKKKRRIK